MMNLRVLLLLTLLIAPLILLGCTSGGNGASCSADSDCKTWQYCSDEGKCVPKNGYCYSVKDCGNSEIFKCDKKTHRCSYLEGKCGNDADCSYWQICDKVLSECKVRAGFCDKDEMCSNPWEVCNFETHKCEPAPGRCINSFDCESWEQCNTDKKLCEPLLGRCNNDIDCDEWEECQTKEHTCKVKKGFCNDENDCRRWEYCDIETRRCTAKEGRCNVDEDCGEGLYCNERSHECKSPKNI